MAVGHLKLQIAVINIISYKNILSFQSLKLFFQNCKVLRTFYFCDTDFKEATKVILKLMCLSWKDTELVDAWNGL